MLDFRRDILQAMHRGRTAHGDLVQYRLGPVAVHGVSSPELAAEVLTDTGRFGKLGPDNPLRLVLGEGLLTSDDHKSWLRNRRMMQPIYTKQALAGMFATMGVSAAEQIAHMADRYRTGAVVDLHTEMMRVTLDIVSRCMFSTDVSRTLAGLGPDAVDVAINYAFDRLQNPLSPPTSWPTPATAASTRSCEASTTSSTGSSRNAGSPTPPPAAETSSTCCWPPATPTPARA